MRFFWAETLYPKIEWTVCSGRMSSLGTQSDHSTSFEKKVVTAVACRSLWDGVHEGASQKLLLVAWTWHSNWRDCDMSYMPEKLLHATTSPSSSMGLAIGAAAAHSCWLCWSFWRSDVSGSSRCTQQVARGVYHEIYYCRENHREAWWNIQSILFSWANCEWLTGVWKIPWSKWVQHIPSAPYHPSTNGLAERFVQSMKNALKALQREGPLHQQLNNFLLSYRNVSHSTSKAAPAIPHTLMKRQLHTNLDLLKPPKTKQTVLQKQQAQTDRHTCMAKERVFHPDDHVLARNYNNGPKWVPATVVAQMGPVSYTVKTTEDIVWKRHADQLLFGSAVPVEFPPANAAEPF